MAKTTPKKDSKKKTSTKSEAAVKAAKKPAAIAEEEVVVAEVKTITSSPEANNCDYDENHPLKGFFKTKHEDENVSNIFNSKKIWGALIGELIGTMFLSMLLLTLGVQPLYIIFAVVCIYVAIVGISGAHLNPLVTAGAMATRRVSAIRGILYILAQIIGAWIGLLIINAFRIGSGTSAELPTMASIAGDTFWACALVEMIGAFIIAFTFARSAKYSKKNPLTFAFAVASAMTLAVIVGLVISQSFFSLSDTFLFNPAIAFMYQIIPTTAEGFGELVGAGSLAILTYVIFPMIGGICGFFISDVAARLSGDYGCKDHCCKK